jgi:hypothetical protein
VVDTDLRTVDHYFDAAYDARNDMVQLSFAYQLTDALKASSLTSWSRDKVVADIGSSPEFTNGFNVTPPDARRCVRRSAARRCRGTAGARLQQL